MFSYCRSGRAFKTTSCCHEFSLLAFTTMRGVTGEDSEGTCAASLCNVSCLTAKGKKLHLSAVSVLLCSTVWLHICFALGVPAAGPRGLCLCSQHRQWSCTAPGVDHVNKAVIVYIATVSNVHILASNDSTFMSLFIFNSSYSG